jgi:peptidoglycan hydrolase-like protein with peptidoglycan-binding domain
MPRRAIAASCATAVVLAAGGLVLGLAHRDSGHRAGASLNHADRGRSGGSGRAGRAGRAGGPGTSGTSGTSGASSRPGSPGSAGGSPGSGHPVFRVDWIRPTTGTSGASWRADVLVHFSEPLAASDAFPVLEPAAPGAWSRAGPQTLCFRPSGNYVPFTKETLTVPASSRSTAGTSLGHVVTSTFTVAGASELRLQQLLATLGYLPLRFVPAGASARGPARGPASGSPGTSPDEPTVPGEVALGAVRGRFAWRYSSTPLSLVALWSPGAANEITLGAVMAFESAHGLGDDGIAGPLVWRALLAAAAHGEATTAPYNYVLVNQALPESVTIWSNGADVFTTPANTGIAQAPTEAGTWPVYVRYLTTTMSGTEPNGQHYSDPGIPWVSYFHGGDALHGYLRAGYGYPQSLGCVEMTYAAAKVVYSYTPVGTLVTVLKP